MAKKRQKILAAARKSLGKSPRSGHVVIYSLKKDIAFTPDSPVHIPVNPGNGPNPYQVTFECDSKLTNGVTVVLPAGVAVGSAVIHVMPGKPVVVDIDRSVPQQIPIPYSAYYDERNPAQRRANKRGRHGYVESNSPPAMQVGP